MFGKLGEAFVEIGAKMAPFDAALNNVRGKMAGLATARFNIPLLGGLGAFAALAGIGLGIRKVINAASDLNEAANMSKVVFADSFGTVSRFADEMADKFGLVKTKVFEAASSFGAIAQGAGYAEKASADFSIQMTKLAADLTSAKNIPFDEAIVKIQAALSGEAEPLRRYGANITEAAVKQYALAHGIARAGEELSDQQKVMARSALIARGLGFAHGDLERTINDYANATRASEGRVENLAATIGTTLMPAFNELRALLNQVLIDFTASHDGMTSKLQAFTGTLQSAIGNAGVVYRNFGLIVERVGTTIAGYLLNAGEVFRWLGKVIADFLSWFSTNWKTIFSDTFNWVLDALLNLGENLKNFGASVYDLLASGFSKPFEFKITPLIEKPNVTPGFQMPKLELTNMDEQFKAIDRKMGEVEAKHAEMIGKAAAPAEVKKKQVLPGDVAAKKEAKAEFVGLADFAKKIQAGVFDKDKDAMGRRTASATERSAVALETLVKRPPAGVAVAAGPA